MRCIQTWRRGARFLQLRRAESRGRMIPGAPGRAPFPSAHGRQETPKFQRRQTSMQSSNPQTPSTQSSRPGITRRTLMSNTTAAAVGAAAGSLLNFGFPSGVYAAGSGTIRVGLVGCGGRGSGAAVNALNGDPEAKLVA